MLYNLKTQKRGHFRKSLNKRSTKRNSKNRHSNKLRGGYLLSRQTGGVYPRLQFGGFLPGHQLGGYLVRQQFGAGTFEHLGRRLDDGLNAATRHVLDGESGMVQMMGLGISTFFSAVKDLGVSVAITAHDGLVELAKEANESIQKIVKALVKLGKKAIDTFNYMKTVSWNAMMAAGKFIGDTYHAVVNKLNELKKKAEAEAKAIGKKLKRLAKFIRDGAGEIGTRTLNALKDAKDYCLAMAGEAAAEVRRAANKLYLSMKSTAIESVKASAAIIHRVKDQLTGELLALWKKIQAKNKLAQKKFQEGKKWLVDSTQSSVEWAKAKATEAFTAAEEARQWMVKNMEKIGKHILEKTKEGYIWVKDTAKHAWQVLQKGVEDGWNSFKDGLGFLKDGVIDFTSMVKEGMQVTVNWLGERRNMMASEAIRIATNLADRAYSKAMGFFEQLPDAQQAYDLAKQRLVLVQEKIAESGEVLDKTKHDALERIKASIDGAHQHIVNFSDQAQTWYRTAKSHIEEKIVPILKQAGVKGLKLAGQAATAIGSSVVAIGKWTVTKGMPMAVALTINAAKIAYPAVEALGRVAYHLGEIGFGLGKLTLIHLLKITEKILIEVDKTLVHVEGMVEKAIARSLENNLPSSKGDGSGGLSPGEFAGHLIEQASNATVSLITMGHAKLKEVSKWTKHQFESDEDGKLVALQTLEDAAHKMITVGQAAYKKLHDGVEYAVGEVVDGVGEVAKKAKNVVVTSIDSLIELTAPVREKLEKLASVGGVAISPLVDPIMSVSKKLMATGRKGIYAVQEQINESFRKVKVLKDSALEKYQEIKANAYKKMLEGHAIVSNVIETVSNKLNTLVETVDTKIKDLKVGLRSVITNMVDEAALLISKGRNKIQQGRDKLTHLGEEFYIKIQEFTAPALKTYKAMEEKAISLITEGQNMIVSAGEKISQCWEEMKGVGTRALSFIVNKYSEIIELGKHHALAIIQLGGETADMIKNIGKDGLEYVLKRVNILASSIIDTTTILVNSVWEQIQSSGQPIEVPPLSLLLDYAEGCVIKLYQAGAAKMKQVKKAINKLEDLSVDVGQKLKEGALTMMKAAEDLAEKIRRPLKTAGLVAIGTVALVGEGALTLALAAKDEITQKLEPVYNVIKDLFSNVRSGLREIVEFGRKFGASTMENVNTVTESINNFIENTKALIAEGLRLAGQGRDHAINIANNLLELAKTKLDLIAHGFYGTVDFFERGIKAYKKRGEEVKAKVFTMKKELLDQMNTIASDILMGSRNIYNQVGQAINAKIEQAVENASSLVGHVRDAAMEKYKEVKMLLAEGLTIIRDNARGWQNRGVKLLNYAHENATQLAAMIVSGAKRTKKTIQNTIKNASNAIKKTKKQTMEKVYGIIDILKEKEEELRKDGSQLLAKAKAEIKRFSKKIEQKKFTQEKTDRMKAKVVIKFAEEERLGQEKIDEAKEMGARILDAGKSRIIELGEYIKHIASEQGGKAEKKLMQIADNIKNIGYGVAESVEKAGLIALGLGAITLEQILAQANNLLDLARELAKEGHEKAEEVARTIIHVGIAKFNEIVEAKDRLLEKAEERGREEVDKLTEMINFINHQAYEMIKQGNEILQGLGKEPLALGVLDVFEHSGVEAEVEEAENNVNGDNNLAEFDNNGLDEFNNDNGLDEFNNDNGLDEFNNDNDNDNDNDDDEDDEDDGYSSPTIRTKKKGVRGSVPRRTAVHAGGYRYR